MANAPMQFLARMQRAWGRSPMPTFLSWWGAELAGMLPARLRSWVLRGPDVLWLSATADGVSVYRARNGERLAEIAADSPTDARRAAFVEACAGIDPDDRRQLLVLSTTQVLQRRLVMPLAAAGDPRRAASYEIDRQTPFKPEQVYFDVRIDTKRAPSGQLAMDLFVVPKASMDSILADLETLGAPPERADVRLEDDALAGVDLLPARRQRRRFDRRRQLNWGLGVGCAALLILALAQWLADRKATLATMQTEVKTLEVKAAASKALHARLAGALAASAFLVKRKQETPSPLEVLNELTKRLPASAWLASLSLDDSGNLRISGEADKAAALVDQIKRSPLLQNPKLQGAILPDASTGKERFELVVQVRQQGAANAH